jgi:prevent-host-death family protein
MVMSVALKKDESVWQLQQAKARFSEVVNRAVDAGPQLVTRHGRPSVYVISAETYRREFCRGDMDRKSILRSIPLSAVELDLSRERSAGREVEL